MSNSFVKHNLRVGYQGSAGAYSHLAGQRHFLPHKEKVDFIGFHSFNTMLDAVKNHETDSCILPVENSIAGTVHDALSLLLAKDLHIVAEEIQPVNHCLIAIQEASPQDIRRVYSHPQALAQCSHFLDQLTHCEALAYLDTAMAVQKIQTENDPTSAAIASLEAATLHGLVVIKTNIANVPNNQTRMLVISKDNFCADDLLPSKISIVFDTKHEHGALLDVLSALSENNLNLTKIESRPKPETPFQYRFYVEFDGNLAHASVKAALALVEKRANYCKILGCYRIAKAV